MRAWISAVPLLVMAAACSDSAIEELRALARRDAPCTTPADCCVVFEQCYSTAYVVGSGDYARAQRLVSQVDHSDCTRCMSPPVALECVDGACLGRALPFEGGAEGNGADHCGTVSDPAEDQALRVDGIQAADPEPASETGRMLGCGT